MQRKLILIALLTWACMALQATEGPEMYDSLDDGRQLTYYNPPNHFWSRCFRRCRRRWRRRTREKFCNKACRCLKCDDRLTPWRIHRCRRRRRCCFWDEEFSLQFANKCANYPCVTEPPADLTCNLDLYNADLPTDPTLQLQDKRCFKYYHELNSSPVSPRTNDILNSASMEKDAFSFGDNYKKLTCDGVVNSDPFDESLAYADMCFPKGLDMPAVATECEDFKTCELAGATYGEEPTGGFTSTTENTEITDNLSKINNSL